MSGYPAAVVLADAVLKNRSEFPPGLAARAAEHAIATARAFDPALRRNAHLPSTQGFSVCGFSGE